MNLLVVFLLTASVFWHRTCCRTVTTTDRSKIIPSSIETSTQKSIENSTERQFLRTNPFPKENSSKIQELTKIANVNVDPSNRKSKILRTLAFLTGLSVSGLTKEQPYNVKTSTKFNPLAVNIDTSRVSPQIAAIYNPYAHLAHSYIMTAPLGFYPFWDPLRLQSFGGLHNNFQSLSENLQTLNLSDDNKRIDASSNNDEYVGQANKVENVKISNGNAEDTTELEVEDDRFLEDKMMTSDVTCGAQKKMNKKQLIPTKDVFNDRETDDIEQITLANLSVRNGTITRNDTAAAVSNVGNSTGSYNFTSYPFHGYYGGYPQDINHVDLTTDTNDYKYHEYDHVDYNLPSYDKPVNFYTDQKYNYYSAPSDSYLPNQFHQEQIPEYFSNDFKKYVYSPDNTASFPNNDFRPVLK